jgi:hypothetical protein
VIWLVILLTAVVGVAALIWWAVAQPRTEPQAPLLPGVFGPNPDVLEVDRELSRAMRGSDRVESDDDGAIV